MYCPKCSHPQLSETARFCSRCGFQLDAVKELLAAESAPGPDEGGKLLPLRQRDITLGAALMFVGAVKAAFIGSTLSSVLDIWFLIILAVAFAFLQLLSQLAPGQRGLSLGATLMFGGALGAFLMAASFGPLGWLVVATAVVPLILFWQRLAKIVYRSFFASASSPNEKPERPDQGPILPPAPNYTVTNLTPKRINTADMAAPPSVTEGTTRLMED